MADNFDVKQFLFENKLGAYSKLKTEGEAAYEYEKGKAAGEKIEKEKLKEDSDENYDIFMDGVLDVLVKDKLITKADVDVLNRGGADDLMDALHDEWEGFKNYEETGQAISRSDLNLAARAVAKKIGKLKEDLDKDRTDAEAEKMMDFLAEKEKEESLKEGGDVFADIDDDIAYGTDSKEDAIEYLEDIIDYCQKKIVELENEQGYEEEDDLDEAMGGKNPEGDALVLRFLQGVAKKFNYPVSQAAVFVKNTIKSLGY